MQSSRSMTIAALCLLAIALFACGGDDSGSEPVAGAEFESQLPPPAPPMPHFDRSLLFGDWDTSIEDPENGMRLDIKANYVQDGFSIHGTVTMTDPNKPSTDGLKEFVVTGTWTLEGETLIETATESTFPLWRVGVSSPAVVKRLDKSTFAFERSGVLMTFTRI